jgi:glutathione synthase/RimK-type ligase-like ATP-grasp enzyme
MTTHLYPYHTASVSAKLVAEAMGIKRIKRKNSKFEGHPSKTVINWGCRKLPAEPRHCNVINHSVFVEPCSNKLTFFRNMNKEGCGDVIPPYTNDPAQAVAWVNKGDTVVCRTKLRSHSGRGIVMAEKVGDVVPAKLYTKYIPKKNEYRVYICGEPRQGEVIDVARKARRKDCPNPNWQVRSWHNGFVFARKDCNPPQAVLDAAVRCHNASMLHFSAVDVVYNDREKKAYVLEINTAPGVEGQTIQVYADALAKLTNPWLIRRDNQPDPG